MRTRIALVAAVAAFSVFGAAAAEAVTSTSGQSKAGAEQPGIRHAERRPAPRRRPAPQTPLRSPELMRSIELKVWWQRASGRPEATPPPPPPPAPPPPAPPVPSPVQQPVAVSATSDATSTDATSTTTPDWACIREHESGDNYAENTGNGYSGAYQFLPSTWNESVSGAGYPKYANGEAYEAPPAVQDAAALWLYNRDGWTPWSTRYVCGL